MILASIFVFLLNTVILGYSLILKKLFLKIQTIYMKNSIFY